MRTPAAAFAWEFGSRHRWLLVAMPAYLLLLAAIKPLVIAPGAVIEPGDGFAAIGVVPFSFAFMYFIAVFSFGLNGDIAARQSIFPARLLTLPVTTAELARWPMVCGAVAMTLLWVFASMVARWGLDMNIPLVWPGFMAVVVLAWTQAFTWMPYGVRGIRVVAATAILIALDTVVLIAINLNVSEGALIAFLAPQLPFAYLLACYALGRARRGVVPDWTISFGRSRAGTLDARKPFSSAARAQLWFEWRRHGRSLPVLVAIVLPFELFLYFVGGYGSKGFVWFVTIAILVTPIIMAAFAATTISKANPFAREVYGVSPFLATRPLTSAELIAAKLQMAWWSTAAAWAVMAIVAPIGMAWSGAGSVVVDWLQRMTDTVGIARAVVLMALIVGLLVMSTWVMLVQSLYLGLTGKNWIIKTSGFVVLMVFSLLGPAFKWFINDTDAERWLWDNWPALIGALVAMKMVAGLWVATRLHRRGLVTDQRLLLLTAAWLAAVGVLYGTVIWWIDTPFFPRYAFAMVATLAVPYARLAAAPLAIAANRHR